MDPRPGFRAPWKGQPQQGTLFHAPAEELDPTGQRFQSIRGFTPERQHEVGEAMGEVGYSHTRAARHAALGRIPVLSPGEFEDIDPTPEMKRDFGEGAARMRESLARSTAPIEDIASVEQYAVAPHLDVNGLWLPRDETLLFGRSARDVQMHRSEIGDHPTPEVQRMDAGQTVIHELGHAADPKIAPTRGVRNTLEGYNMGAVEERADDYAEQHFRHDPRASRREHFAVEAAMYPGAYPGQEAPARLPGYEKWGERSERAMGDLGPRQVAAEQRGELFPQTPPQRQYAAEARLREMSAKPDQPEMFPYT